MFSRFLSRRRRGHQHYDRGSSGRFWAATVISSGSVLSLVLAWIGTNSVAFGAVASSESEPRHRPRIAVIGGGIGGTSAAYFTRKLFGERVPIDIYDINEEVGGRTATVHIAGRDYECGASIIHPSNRYMVQFVEELGLSKRVKVSTTSGFYNGEEFVLIESDWSVVTIAKLLWRYGWDFIRLFREVDAWMKQFKRIYTYQDDGHTYKTVEDLVSVMGGEEFVNATLEPLIPMLKSHGYSERFITEIVAAATRVNYGQDKFINAFAGMVSLAGVQPGLWAVHDGNNKVSQALLNASKATLYKSLVTSVELNSTARPRETFNIHSIPWQQTYKETQQHPKDLVEYDIVIVALPQHGAPPTQYPINFAGFDARKSHVPKGPFPGEYRRTVANFISGTPRAETFGFENAKSLPDSILTVVEPKLQFRSLAKNFPVDITQEEANTKHTYVYKVFASGILSKEQMDALFVDYSEVKHCDWMAYPYYGTTGTIPPFELYPGVYYVNGIEWAASALEMSVIGSKNAALLAHQHWTGQGSNEGARDEAKFDGKTEL